MRCGIDDGLVFVQARELHDPCWRLIVLAAMAGLMQIERLQSAGEGEEEDRWRNEEADVEMHLAQKT